MKTDVYQPRKAGRVQNVAGEGVVIVDSSFTPIALDDGAEAILSDVSEQRFHRGAVTCLPPAVRELLNTQGGQDVTSKKMYFSVDNCEYSCRPFVMEPGNGSTMQPMLALYLKREVSVIDVVQRVAAEYRLTKREEETLIGVAMGLTSKELAKRMVISQNTVNAFLRLVMIKLGVTTRVALIATVLQQSAPPGHLGLTFSKD